MPESENKNQSPLRLIITFIVVLLVPLAIGLTIAPRLVPQPKIGIARLNYEIAGLTTQELTDQMAFARQDPSIKAVVLIINSPGGSAAYSEELYLDVLNTREQMPVVATIDLLAASGAYYMAAAADEIYAKPTSSVGSIGVISGAAGDVFLPEDLLTTGPYKAFGGTRDGFMRQIERAKHAFLQAVVVGRGDRLKVGTDFLSRAEIFTGVQALDMGLIDGLIANDAVIQRAATLAGLADYEIVELFPLTFGEEQQQPFFSYQPPAVDPQRLWAPPTNLAPGIHYRYVE